MLVVPSVIQLFVSLLCFKKLGILTFNFDRYKVVVPISEVHINKRWFDVENFEKAIQ